MAVVQRQPVQCPSRSIGHRRIGITCQSLYLWQQACIAAVSRCIKAIAHHPVTPDPFDWRSGKYLAECRIVQRQKVCQPWRAQFSAGQKRAVGLRAGGKAVPRTGGKAIIAAVNAVAHRGAQFFGKRPFVFDRQIGNAAPRIQPVGGGKGVGWASCLAGVA